MFLVLLVALEEPSQRLKTDGSKSLLKVMGVHLFQSAAFDLRAAYTMIEKS